MARLQPRQRAEGQVLHIFEERRIVHGQERNVALGALWRRRSGGDGVGMREKRGEA